MNYEHDITVYLEKSTTNNTENFIYKNPHKYNLAESNFIKFNLKDYKESYVPMVRLYNYSELNVNFIDQILTPPALFSFTIGKVSHDFKIIEETNEYKICKQINLRMTTCASVFDENLVIDLLTNLSKFLKNPLTISL